MSWVTTVTINGRYIPKEAQAMLSEGVTNRERWVQFGSLSDYTPAERCNGWDHWRGGKGRSVAYEDLGQAIGLMQTLKDPEIVTDVERGKSSIWPVPLHSQPPKRPASSDGERSANQAAAMP